MSQWGIENSRAAYNVRHWGGGYFEINEQGHVCVQPDRRSEGSIDLHELAWRLPEAGLSLPVLVRFNDILHDRVRTLVGAFTSAMEEDGYQGGYTAVYPIKVNQQQSVVAEILHPDEGRVGLEAGSKPELMAVLGMVPPGGVVVCNGYKDREYVRLALVGKALGLRVYVVVEKRSELELVIEEATALGIEPLIGVRVRLASIGAGKWQNTGGEKSKFGLSAAEALQMIHRLREVKMLPSLKLLHCHLGSQIANIRDIQRGTRELARFYAEFRRLGVDLEVVDVGGGLGIDYEGTRSRSSCSMNYTVQEYAKNVVHALWEVCEDHELPHPHIFSESGRAMTAHHAVLITNVIDIEQVPAQFELAPPGEDEPLILHDLWDGLEALTRESPGRSVVEAYHDAVHWLSEAQIMYTHGILSLEQRARAEQIYFVTCRQVQKLLPSGSRAHRELLDELHEKLADKYFCNFSLFQSLPDIWAIEQIFPIMPLHRLDEEPTRRGVLEDITCDSDGRIDHYVDGEGVESSLPLHEVRPGEPYLIGMFLVGAYQEILGDLHNLFGDTDSVNVELTSEGGYRLTSPQRGDTVGKVLRYVHHDPEHLMSAYRRKAEQSELLPQARELLLETLALGLEGYTYFEE